MKLLLHIGHSKTGTTAIQNFFKDNHKALGKIGILYPVKRAIAPNHIHLAAGFVKYDSIYPPHKRFYMGNFKKYKNDYYRFKNYLDREIKNKNYNTLVLSAEQLFIDFSDISEKKFANFLKPYFSEIKVIVYIREPISDYVARTAQRIKTGYNFHQPFARKIRHVLEYYESQFPGCVYVNAFEKMQLLDGDVTLDFITKYLPKALSIYSKSKTHIRLNESLPASLLFTLNKERLWIQSNNDIPDVRTNAWIAMIKKNALKHMVEIGNTKLVLKPKLKKYIEASAADYLWLKRKYGVSFGAINYKKIKLSEITGTYYAKLSDIFVFEELNIGVLNKIIPARRKINIAFLTLAYVTYHQILRIYTIYFSSLSSIIKKLNTFKAHDE